jgi:excisionase family DNA binding protein
MGPNPSLAVVRGGGGLLTVAQVAEALQVCRATAYRAVASGELASIRVSNAIRVRPDDLERLLGQGSAL